MKVVFIIIIGILATYGIFAMAYDAYVDHVRPWIRKWRNKGSNAEPDSDYNPSVNTGGEKGRIPLLNIKTKNMANEYDGMKAPEIGEALLKKLNCQYEKDDDGSITFSYQGAVFNLFSSAGSPFITIAYLWWDSVPLDKLEHASCMRKAINDINLTFRRTTTFYSINEKDNQMIVGSKCNGLLMPQIPDLTDYFESNLSELFQAARSVDTKYREECSKEGLEIIDG